MPRHWGVRPRTHLDTAPGVRAVPAAATLPVKPLDNVATLDFRSFLRPRTDRTPVGRPGRSKVTCQAA